MFEHRDIVVAINPGSTATKVKVFLRERGEVLLEEKLPDSPSFRAFLKKLKGASRVVFGIRVVHGGERDETTLITDEVLSRIREFVPFAPIHNTLTIERIEAIQATFPQSKLVAIFDTRFHHTIPEEHRTYLIEREVRDRFHVRKYGFHGIALQSVVKKISEQCEREGKSFPEKLVVAHLGGGCSLTAVLHKKSFATTMELTPVSGIPMITRAGSVDPGIYPILVAQGFSLEEVYQLLNEKSGFYGVLGSKDTKEIFERAERGDEESLLAFRAFVSEIVQRIAGYAGLMGGLDAIAFSGGIGYGNAYLRASVLEKLSPSFTVGEDEIYTIDVDEEEVMYEEIIRFVV